ncbi:MAG: hypothetical protein ACREBA_10670, partial [Nitrosotalea sp.]
WLSVSIPESSFDLAPTIPYYSMINFSSNNAPLGEYPISIGENIGGSRFVQDVTIKIFHPPMYGGLRLGPPSRVSAEQNYPENNQSNDMNNTIILTEVGIPITIGISVGMFLFTRKRK